MTFRSHGLQPPMYLYNPPLWNEKHGEPKNDKVEIDETVLPKFEEFMKQKEILSMQFARERQLFARNYDIKKEKPFNEIRNQFVAYAEIRAIFYNYRSFDLHAQLRSLELIRELLSELNKKPEPVGLSTVLSYYLASHINRYLEAKGKYPDKILVVLSMLEMYLGLYFAYDKIEKKTEVQRNVIQYAMDECVLGYSDLCKKPDLAKLSKEIDKKIQSARRQIEQLELKFNEKGMKDEDELQVDRIEPQREQNPKLPTDWAVYLRENFQKKVLDSDLFEAQAPVETLLGNKRSLLTMEKGRAGFRNISIREAQAEKTQNAAQINGYPCRAATDRSKYGS